MKTKRIYLVVLLIAGLVLLAGCGGKKADPSKNIEQIQREEGVPVHVEIVTPHLFARDLVYSATISGAMQSGEYSKVDGRVERVNVKVGDRVEKGQVLVEFPTDLPTVQYASVVASYNLAKSTAERMRALYARGGVSKQELDGVETQLKASETQLDAVNQMLRVRAPISGVVTEVAVQESDNVRNDDPLFTVSQLNKMKATVWVSDTEIGEVKKGMGVTCSWNGSEASGKVIDVAMAMDPARQGFAVEIEFANPGGALKAGVLAKVMLRTYVNPKAYVVARKNLRSDAQGAYVFVDNQGTASKRYIQTGEDSGFEIEVTGGLNQDDRLIVDGLNLVEDGAKLKVLE
jgi:membrane fusion protein, multidrug efflux system